MRAAFLTGPEEIAVRDVPPPDVPERGMLVKNLACGICGSDLRTWKAGDIHRRGGIGHEVVGYVLAMGKACGALKEGQRVVVAPVSCGRCSMCQTGREHICPQRTHAGFGGPGGFSEILPVPEETLDGHAVFPVPDEIDTVVASLCEPLACVLNGQDKVTLTPDSTVVVLGGGPVGVMHAAISRLRGADRVFITEIHPERLKLARWVDADMYIDSSAVDPVKAVLDATHGEGADVAIVCCSDPKAQSDAVNMVRRAGLVILFSGLPPGKGVIPFDVETVHRKEICVLGSRNAGRRQFMRALGMLVDRRIQWGKLITHVLPLDMIDHGFRVAASGQAMKVVITFSAG